MTESQVFQTLLTLAYGEDGIRAVPCEQNNYKYLYLLLDKK
jgi:hypothetical protein